MRHTDAMDKIGGVLGVDPGVLPDRELTSLDRALDEVFEAGYQAGYVDGRENRPSNGESYLMVGDL